MQNHKDNGVFKGLVSLKDAFSFFCIRESPAAACNPVSAERITQEVGFANKQKRGWF